jgi:tetratricopeptide (TPR) repeat protein
VAAYYNRGNAYNGKGNYDKAIVDFTQAINLDPNYAAAYYNRGLAYANKGDYDKVITDLEAVLRIDPHHPYAGEDIKYVRQARGW